MVQADGRECEALAAAGLKETYRRRHHGQGTSNRCYAFENLFIELLTVESAEEAASDPIRRTRLLERSRGKENGACPFGIAWREPSGASFAALKTWNFVPPYLPAGSVIRVAEDGDDPLQPMMFSFPGTTAPSEWSPERQNGLQTAFGWQTAHLKRLVLKDGVSPSPGLSALAREAGF